MDAHVHADDAVTNDANNFYEVCACGASRRRPMPGVEDEPWHLCSMCAMPGFEPLCPSPKRT